MSESLTVLMVEDSEDDALLVLRELRRGGFTLTWERVQTAEALRDALSRHSWDVIISDYRLPGFDAPAALEIVKQSRLDLPFLVVSGTIGETLAVELMKAGAHDYLMKGNLTRLSEAVRREIREAQIRAERKQATLELDQTKERLQLAIEGSSIGLWDWSVQTGAVTLNDRWAAMIGYSLEELEPISIETWRHHTHPEDLQRATQLLEQHFRQEIPIYECELRMRHQAGHWVWVLARGKVVERDEAGNPLRMIGTHLDITDRKRSEATLYQLNRELEERVERRTAALKQSEIRLRTAQQVARLGSWELDVQTEEITWSDEVFNIFGLSPDQAEPDYQQLLQTYFPPEERDRLDDLIKRAVDSKEPYSTDLQIIRADGSSGYIFAKAELSLNADGQVDRLFGIAMDISDRKAMQEALQRSEERTRATLLALPDLVFRVNREGQYVDFMVSPQGRNLVDPHQVIGKSIYEGLPPDVVKTYADAKYSAIEQALATQTVQSYEQQVQIEGKLCYEEVRVAPCGNDEVVFFVRDISDRKRAEEQLQQTNAELARATRLKDEFLANMSHELRTPLTSILGMSDVLKEEVFGKLNEKQNQYIDVISQSGKHLLSLINDILDLAKIESGKLELQFASVLVPVLCSSSVSFVKHMAHQKKIKLSSHLPSDIGEIYVDELRIKQALINLLSNAVKFTPSGGEVTLEVSCDRAQSSIQFSVIDTGIGIAPEDIPKLFQSFVQIDSSLNRQYNGTGLGLALVKQIIELHQGSVTVESTPGQGSRFTIILPTYSISTMETTSSQSIETRLFPTSSPPENSLTSPSSPSDSALILLAEDNQANIDTFSAYLTCYGYRLMVVTHGLEVVAAAQRHQPDLILMDIQMPGMDGLEITHQIRKIPELVNTPIIALTALAMSDDRERCLAAGANDYLAKPVQLKQLAKTVQDWLYRVSV